MEVFPCLRGGSCTLLLLLLQVEEEEEEEEESYIPIESNDRGG